MKTYLSAALASASNIREACARYEAIANGLDRYGIKVYVPHHFTHPARDSHVLPAEVYLRDSARLLESAYVVAVLDEPSFGVGAEIALAMAHQIPVVGVVSSARVSSVSRYIVGLLGTGRHPNLMVYEEISSLVDAVAALLNSGCPSTHPEELCVAERVAQH